MVRNCKKQTINCGYVVCWSGFGQRHCWSSVGHKIECWSSNGQASLWCDQHVSNKLATVYIARHSVELVRWFTPFWRILPMSIADNCTVGRKMPRTCKYRRELLPLNQSRDWSRGNNSLLYLQTHDRTFVESTWLQLILEKARTTDLLPIKPWEGFELQTSRQQQML